ncbi:MAG: pentapeptide repeat-containing protein [Methylocystis sp.]
MTAVGNEATLKYDQRFFLALAAMGKDAWNAWRRDRANAQVGVTFADVNFSEAPGDEINFEGFDFGDYANFSNCSWRGFNLAKWSSLEPPLRQPRVFTSTAFQPGRAYFHGAAFGRGANFSRAHFGDWASFSGVTFGQDADFTGTVFGDHTTFDDAAFAIMADFTNAAFGISSFCGAGFELLTKFNQTHFNAYVDFSGKTKEQLDYNAHRRNEDEKLRRCFSFISFAGAIFDGEANFSNRAFERNADFTLTQFYSPPNFELVTGAGRIDLTGAQFGFVPSKNFFHLTHDSKIPVRFRALRLFMEETKNHDLERDIYIEERKSERGVYLWQRWEELKKAPWTARGPIFLKLFTHLCWIVVMFLYWALANYGRSFTLPAIWLGLSVPIFHWGYEAALAPLALQASSAYTAKYTHALWMVTLGNAVPLIGATTIDDRVKAFLFCPSGNADCLPPIPPDGYQLIVLTQNLLSIALVFFIGLALRNYFKIR